MTVNELIESGIFNTVNVGYGTGRTVTKPFACDLLSLALVKAVSGSAWFTVIGNVNTIAVSVHTDCSCIVLCEGVNLDNNAYSKAKEHGVTVLRTDLPVFDAALELSTMIAQ